MPAPDFQQPETPVGHADEVIQEQFLRRNKSWLATAAWGQFLPPSFVVSMEELASTPDAKAHNRYATEGKRLAGKRRRPEFRKLADIGFVMPTAPAYLPAP